ncbi:GyrI-like domain-containing protein [Nocardia lijiangensis]|uniref:GyrI-like domain-containing protein n=1 Tax=Nocardia lijiangensis TaxID=299618 RepID=UPI003D741F41
MKIDLAKSDKQYYTAPAEPGLRTFEGYDYAMITGSGAPTGPEYTEAVALLYQAAYGAKKVAKADGRDFVVPKLEGLWWVESDEPPLSVPREQWHWTMMIRMPEGVTAAMIGEGPVRFERLVEGESVQVLHVGPYATEPETLDRMEKFMAAEGLTPHGRHHEIYLTDPRKVPGDRTRTILRQPVRRSS